MKHRIHLVGGNFANPYGMEYYTLKAIQAEGIDYDYTSYRTTISAETSLRMKDIHADILLVMKGEMVDPMMVYSAPRYSVLWYQDDIFTTEHGKKDMLNLGWAFDKVYIFDKCAIQECKNLGARDVDWLPLACDPETHKPMDVSKEFNVSMVGHMFPNRQRLYEKLNKRFDKILFTTDYQRYPEIVAKSKINLNLGIGPTGIQMRVFELLSMKSFVMSNDMKDGKLFEDKKHLVYYTDDTICDLIDYYLQNEDECMQIANEGYREVLNKHTYRHRVRKIIEDYEKWEEN